MVVARGGLVIRGDNIARWLGMEGVVKVKSGNKL